MALELQNEEQQRIISDNLSIAASNRLATGNLSTQESIQRVQRDVGTGVDTFGTGKALTKGYSLSKDVRAAGASSYLSGEMGRTAQFASEKAQPVRDAVSAVRGFKPAAVTGAAEGTGESIASTAKWLPDNNFENIASRPFVNTDFASASRGVTPAAGTAPAMTTAAAAGTFWLPPQTTACRPNRTSLKPTTHPLSPSTAASTTAGATRPTRPRKVGKV